jgi:hypothetical protein
MGSPKLQMTEAFVQNLESQEKSEYDDHISRSSYAYPTGQATCLAGQAICLAGQAT